jgi:hypothetical protein
MDMKSVGSFYYESFVSVILIVFVTWHTLLLMPALKVDFCYLLIITAALPFLHIIKV